MGSVPDALLLSTAEIAATLIGLVLVAVFFYLETGFRRLVNVGPAAQPFLKATTALIVLQYSMVLGGSLALVALEPTWATVAYVLLALGVVGAAVTWSVRARRLSSALRRAVKIRPLLAWPIVVGPLVLPFAVGGATPDRVAFTVSLFLVGAVAFANTVSLLLLAFDLSGVEAAATRESKNDRAAQEASSGLGAPPTHRREGEDTPHGRVLVE